MPSHARYSMTLNSGSNGNLRPVYGLGTKKSYRGQQSEGKQGLHRFVVAMGVVLATAALVLSFGLI